MSTKGVAETQCEHEITTESSGKSHRNSYRFKGGGDGTNKTILSPDGHQTEQTWMI